MGSTSMYMTFTAFERRVVDEVKYISAKRTAQDHKIFTAAWHEVKGADFIDRRNDEAYKIYPPLILAPFAFHPNYSSAVSPVSHSLPVKQSRLLLSFLDRFVIQFRVYISAVSLSFRDVQLKNFEIDFSIS